MATCESTTTRLRHSRTKLPVICAADPSCDQLPIQLFFKTGT